MPRQIPIFLRKQLEVLFRSALRLAEIGVECIRDLGTRESVSCADLGQHRSGRRTLEGASLQRERALQASGSEHLPSEGDGLDRRLAGELTAIGTQLCEPSDHQVILTVSNDVTQRLVEASSRPAIREPLPPERPCGRGPWRRRWASRPLPPSRRLAA